MPLRNLAATEASSSGFLSLWTGWLKTLARPFRRSTTRLTHYLHVVRHWILTILRGLGISIGVVLVIGVAYKVVTFTYGWRLQRKRERQEQEHILRQQAQEIWRRRFLERQLEWSSQLEIERQAKIRRQAQEQSLRPPPDGVTTTLASIQRPPPPSRLNLYIKHSRDAQAKQSEGNVRLSKCWDVILLGLCSVRVSPAFVPGLIDLTTLTTIWTDGDHDKDLLDLLIRLARQAGLGKVAEVYMKPLLQGDYRPVHHVESLSMSTLSDGTYQIHTFFGAIHAILYSCILPNQSLGEYVQLFTLFTALLRASLKDYLRTENEFHTKINLLVCQEPTVAGQSKAIIGFSASAPKNIKERILEDRRSHLQILNEVGHHECPWPVGNCAEDETFAHLQKWRDVFPKQMNQLHGMIAVSLTLDLADMRPCQACRQCRNLMFKLRKQLTMTILDLAPPKTDGGGTKMRSEGNSSTRRSYGTFQGM